MRLHRDICEACGRTGDLTDDSGKVQPHLGFGKQVCPGPAPRLRACSACGSEVDLTINGRCVACVVQR
jgi:hypothetical protein